MEEESTSAHPARGAASGNYGRPRVLLSTATDSGENNNEELTSTLFASSQTYIVAIAVVTQVIVLAIVAMIMGIAVLTMCAILGELVVVTIVATALERQVVTVTDLATLIEVSITFMITVLTVALAAVGGAGKISESASSIIATKFG